jgi:hypothetical protein
MFLIKNPERVVWGPKVWDKQQIQNFVYNKYNIDFPVPWGNPTNKVYEIQEGIKLLPVKYRPKPEIDDRRQSYVGPLYDYDDEYAYEYYEVQDLNLDQIRQNLLDFISGVRYIHENAGTKITINEVNYFVPTSREERITVMSAAPGTWKLSKAEYSDEYLRWYRSNGTNFVQLNQDQIDERSAAVTNHLNNSFEMERVLTEHVMTLETAEDILSVEKTEFALKQLYDSLTS